MPSLDDIMKMAEAAQAQENLDKVEVEGVSGGGMVKIRATAKGRILGVSIDDSLMNDDKEMLEDLIVTALNDAARKAETTTQERMSGLMPAGMKLPF